MRTLIILATCWCATLARGHDAFDGLRFVDGTERSLGSFSGQTIIIASFAGDCPPIATWLGKEAKAIHAWIEQQKLPVTLVLVTPDVPSDRLDDFDREGGYGMAHALYAFDPVNREAIGRDNFFQCRLVRADGGVEALPFTGTAQHVRALVTSATAGTYRIDPAGITLAPVKELWWAVERGRPQAIRALVAAAKSGATPAGTEAAAVLERVRALLSARQDGLVAQAPSMSAIENLERFVADADGTDTRRAQSRLKELRAMKPMKEEERARDIYQQCQRLLDSPKPDQQKSGRTNLAALAAKMPGTAYGAKAAIAAR
ncbi:MAG: hypothetical protein H0V44_05765 [Planctomycetes bacterium]|nr:hypothetical protein [Planctomycetota bacterium]